MGKSFLYSDQEEMVIEKEYEVVKEPERIGGVVWTPDPYANVKEVDPNGVDQHAHGSKLDAGKPDMSLLLMFGRALEQVSRVGTFGAEKYTRGGWRGVTDGINRYTAAMLRHLFKEERSPVDDDLPVLHAAQVAWNALARLELIIQDAENADEAERRGG